jgi:hypothetical protein
VSNDLYANARERMLGAFNWASLNVVLVAWSGDYVFDEAHLLAADVLAQGAVAESVSLDATGVLARPGGYARTDPIVLPAVPIIEITFLTLCERGLSTDQHKLLCYIDTGVGLPFIGNGLDQVAQPDWLQLRGWFQA